MPKSKCERLYKKLLGKGYSEASAAKISQKATGLALKTGEPPKNPEKECEKNVACQKCLKTPCECVDK
jgi:hypothetical protein